MSASDLDRLFHDPLDSEIPLRWGSRRRLSAPRRTICDLLHFAKLVPSVPMQRRMRLRDVVAARNAWPKHPSWSAIFTKAFALVSAQTPVLRQAYLSFPFGHLYEHPETVASFTIERQWRDENSVFVARIASPETLSLARLDAIVKRHKTAPIEEIENFRRGLALAALPTPLRRSLWWSALNVSGMYRAYYFGTFAVSAVASFGAASLHILSPLTTALNYSPLESDGSLDVRVAYDHRVLDGATLARAMSLLEETLHGPILDELLDGAFEEPPVEAVAAGVFESWKE